MGTVNVIVASCSTGFVMSRTVDRIVGVPEINEELSSTFKSALFSESGTKVPNQLFR